TATLRTRAPKQLVFVVMFLVAVAGCSNPTGPTPSKGTQVSDEEQVRQTFAAFQEALKAGDADKLWALLDDDSRADAERIAQTARDSYAKASPAEKADQEKGLGLPGAELAGLKGPGFLKTKRFLGTYDEVPESKLEKVAVKGDTATVGYVEPDGDK